jgi:hypothetical protein
MQQTDSTFKFVQSWNDQSLNTHHDIVISLDYALYNYNDTPTCGFCVALFESLNDKPRGGGPGYSLAYLPSRINDKCNPDGYVGLEAALYGIAFDINGIFAKRTDLYDGVDYTIKNSVCLRKGIVEDYSFVDQTKNLLYTDNFTIAQQLTSVNQKIEYKQIRISLTKCMTLLEVEVKNENEKNFKKVFVKQLPLIEKRSVKAALLFTTLDQNTKFRIKQFNVAGFPDRVDKLQYVTSCFQDITAQGSILGKKLPGNNDWVVANGQKSFDLYRFDGKQYGFRKTTRSTSNLNILNYRDDRIYAKAGNSLVIYDYKGNDFVKSGTINLPTNEPITAAAGDGDSIVISTTANGEYHYVYNYVSESKNVRDIGTWKFYQSFNFPLTSGFGYVTEMYKEYILAYSKKNCIMSFRREDDVGYVYHQTLLPPYVDARGFGESISIDNYEMIIGAPFGNKRDIKDAGQGEAFHYVLSPFSNQWVLISELGNFFRINSPAGNFGYSVAIKDNTAIVGAPGEAFLNPSVSGVEIPNYGRSYVFRKNELGYFSQKTAVYPLTSDLESYKFFGSQVNTFLNLAVVGLPYTLDKEKSNINIFDLNCLIPEPPEHLPIPISAIQLLDDQGFIIDIDREDYIVKIQVPEIVILSDDAIPLSSYVPLTLSLSSFNRNIAPVTGWEWSFETVDDEGPLTIYYTTENASYTYLSAGVFTIGLSGTNSYGTGTRTFVLSVFDQP